MHTNISCQLINKVSIYILMSLLMPVACFAIGAELSTDDALQAYRDGVKAYRADNYAQARSLFENACASGNSRGCAAFGIMIKGGKGGSQDYEGARVAFLRACQSSYGEGCFQLGVMKDFGEGGDFDLDGAYHDYEVACNLGSGAGCTFFGMKKRDGIVAPMDIVGARSAYERACELEHGLGCYYLAELMHSGNGGPRNVKGARVTFEQSCKLGIKDGCFNLGVMLFEGDGEFPDYVGARTAFEQSCELGNGDGCFNLGNMLRKGEGGVQDYKGARLAHEQACRLGTLVSCFNLGLMLKDGEGGSQDVELAHEVFKKACEGKISNACALASKTAELARTAGMDLLGVQLGMTSEVAEKLLRSNPKLTALYKFSEDPEREPQQFQPYRNGRIFVFSDGGDIVYLYYSKDDKVIAVARRVSEEGLTLRTLKQSLIEKYGVPISETSTQFLWADAEIEVSTCSGGGAFSHQVVLELREGTAVKKGKLSSTGVNWNISSSPDDLMRCGTMFHANESGIRGEVTFYLYNQQQIAEGLRIFREEKRTRRAQDGQDAAKKINL